MCFKVQHSMFSAIVMYVLQLDSLNVWCYCDICFIVGLTQCLVLLWYMFYSWTHSMFSAIVIYVL